MEKQILETNLKTKAFYFHLDEVEYRLISIESELELDNGIKEIENFMKHVWIFQSEEIKDELYTNAKICGINMQNVLRIRLYFLFK